MAVYSDYSVLIFDFKNNHSSYVMQYDINKLEFDEILDVAIDSSGN